MTCCNKEDKEFKNKVESELHRLAQEVEGVVTDYLALEGAPTKKDSLELIFQKQNQFSQYVSKSKPNSYYHHGQERYPYERVKLNCDAIIHEVIELVNGTSWKWWKDYEYNDMDLISENEVAIEENSQLMEKMLDAHEKGGPSTPFLTDEQRATQKQILENSKLEYIQKELIDIAHFLFQACLETGMTSQQFLEMYLDKNKENHNRQDEGY